MTRAQLRAHRKLARCKPRRRRRTLPHAPAPAPAPVLAPVPAPVPPAPPAPVPPPVEPLDTPLAKYAGPFGRAQAERLLWRAGFGPSPGQAEALAAAGLDAAVASLTSPPTAILTGPAPVTDNGTQITQFSGNFHHQLWWFDRMVRSNQSLVERMTLNWHDWFATDGGVAFTIDMIEQNELFRRRALGRFDELLLDVTKGGAMLRFLDGVANYRGHVNENYARELMELFTLGADRGAYTEQDVREQARALTGWRTIETQAGAIYRYESNYHDDGTKTVFGQTGRWGWEDACRLCLEHELHPSFVVSKLWGYFMPGPPSDEDRAKLETLYRDSGYQIRPVVEATLMHPDFYEGPAMVTPPVVMMAGLLRASQRGIETTAWQQIMGECGHKLFLPPDVSGWDESRWMDTTDTHGRWRAVYEALRGREISGAAADGWDPTESPEDAVAKARAYWGNPGLSADTVDVLLGFAESCLPLVMSTADESRLRAKRQNALRQLVGAAPDLSVS